MAWIVLAEAELDAGDAAAGEAASRRALALRAGHPEALARLGRAQWMRGLAQDAVHSLRAAADAAPSHPGIAVWLAHALEDAGDAEAALDAYTRAHALAASEPQIAAYLLAWRRRLCDWQDLDRLARQVRDAVHAGSAAVEPFAFLSEDASAAEQLRCARLRASMLPHAPRSPARARTGGSPLRIGLLSNGFGAHPTGVLIVALLEALTANAQVQTHLFALTPDDGSTIRARLHAAAHALHAVHAQSHASVSQRIRQAGIDVLFDLRGWGGGGTPEVLALRPARVQVNWLAYPGTSGAPWMDCVLADAFVLPDTLAPHFSERVVRLPRCFQPSDTRRELAPPPPRAQLKLPADGQGAVFCCFNNTYKLNPRSMRRAFDVLRGVPGGVLWLLSGPGNADARLRQAATDAGLAADRLVFMAKQPHAEYLSRLQHADLFLDTNPYNAHTTASDALWAGCPVLTVPGDTFAARVAGSLNHHLGMAHMNLDDDDAFVTRAVALGNDPRALGALRGELVERRHDSGLFDMPAFAADFVTAVQAMAADA